MTKETFKGAAGGAQNQSWDSMTPLAHVMNSGPGASAAGQAKIVSSGQSSQSPVSGSQDEGPSGPLFSCR